MWGWWVRPPSTAPRVHIYFAPNFPKTGFYSDFTGLFPPPNLLKNGTRKKGDAPSTRCFTVCKTLPHQILNFKFKKKNKKNEEREQNATQWGKKWSDISKYVIKEIYATNLFYPFFALFVVWCLDPRFVGISPDFALQRPHPHPFQNFPIIWALVGFGCSKVPS